jgi:hypothetical protein
VKKRQRLAYLVAEDERLVRLLLAFGVDAQPLQNGAQPLRRDRHQPRLLALSRPAPSKSQLAGNLFHYHLASE